MRLHRPALLAALIASAISIATPVSAAPTPAVTPSTADANPGQVVLDPVLTQPQPGDSPATLAARRRLAALIARVETDQQVYDRAAQALTVAEAAFARARAVYAADQAAAAEARAEVVATAVRNYVSGLDTAPQLGAVATSTDPSSLLEQLAVVQQIGAQQATTAEAADAAAATARAAKAGQAAAEAKAQRARTQAQDALLTAQASRVVASNLVVSAHLSDVRAQAAAAQRTAHTAGQAAAALKAQSLATGAATEADFRAAASPAAVIAVADGALLRQAAGRTPAPKPTPGVPAFSVPTFGPVDERAVMGPTPDLGHTARYPGRAGAGPVRSLEAFGNDPVQVNWPNGGVGLGVPGTAKPLPANGVTVNPVIAPPVAPVLRAAVAVDAALAQLGRPYVWDAAGPTSFDCSGLTLWAWGHAGIGLPHFAADQALAGVRVAPDQLLPGDLILFGADLHHVGIYLGAGFMIDAPDTGEYVSIQRVSDDGDFSIAVRL